MLIGSEGPRGGPDAVITTLTHIGASVFVRMLDDIIYHATSDLHPDEILTLNFI